MKLIKFKIVAAVIFLIIIPINAQQQQQIPWPTLADSPWPMMKHDPQATGRSPYVGPKTPNVVWTMDMPYGILSGPAIGPDGTLYFGSFAFTQDRNHFYAINPDGTLKWDFLTDEFLANDAGFIVGSDSTIYFGTQGGYIYAITFGGDLRWKYFAGSNVFQYVMNTDLSGNLYFVTGVTGYLHSLNRNGKLNWKVTYESGFLISSPVFSPDGNTIYISGKDNNLYAINLNGTLKWVYQSGKINSIPLVDNEGNIYVVSAINDSSALQSIKPNGDLRWLYNYYVARDEDDSGPTMDKNGNIYFTIGWTSPLFHSQLISIDYNGNFRWNYIFEDTTEFIYQPLISDDEGTIYFGSGWGIYYYAISNEGKLLWKLPLEEWYVLNTSAIGKDGTLYFGTYKSSSMGNHIKTLYAIKDTGTTSITDFRIDMNYTLSPNYPNPFNSVTIIKYKIPVRTLVSLKVYDMLGNEIITLVNQEMVAGTHLIPFDGIDLASGIYILSFNAGDFSNAKKMILLK
jgi:sugar lactone lactonase YvrE